MRIIAFSDTHGLKSAAAKVFDRNTDADLFVFLGDGERELDYVKSLYPDKKVLSVCGNCDFNSFAPAVDIFQADEVKLIFTHGHNHAVKYSTDVMYKLAQDNCAQIALFGHTHCRYLEYRDGIYLINPGSAGCARDGKPACYATIEIRGKQGILCNHVDL